METRAHERKIGSYAPPTAWQLYDLEKDIGEEKDLAKQHDDVVKELGDPLRQMEIFDASHRRVT